MAVEQAPQHLPHHLPTPGEILEWMGHHKTRLTMAAIALGGAGYLMVAHDRGSQNPAVTVNNPISDTLKPADPGAGSEVDIPAVVPTEVTPAAGASASPEPPKPAPTEAPPSPTAEPTKAPVVEDKKEFDCGILSPGACKKAEYITWKTPRGSTAEAIAMTLEAGEKFSIPESMQVAAVEETYQGKPYGYRIVAARKDGSQIIISGDIIPIGVGRIGKELPARTIIAESAESKLPILTGEYTQFIEFTSKEDLNKQFPEQTQRPPKAVINKATPPSQTNTQGGGITLFDVKPPQTSN